MYTKVKNIKSENLGYLLAVTDMFVYGLYPVYANKFSNTMNPLLFGGTALLIGSLPFLFILKIQRDLIKLFSAKFIKPLLLIAILTAIGTLLFFAGTRLTSGINSGLLIQIEPVYSVFVASIFLKEIIKKEQLASTLLMVIGAGIVVYRGFPGINVGDLLIVLSPFFFQISHIIFKRSLIKIKNPNIATTARLFYGGIIVTMVALLFDPGSLGQLSLKTNLVNILLFAFIFRALDLGLWTQALARLPLAKISAILPLSAAVSFTGSVLILGEKPTMYQYIGLLLIGGGMLWLTLQHLRGSKVDNLIQSAGELN